MSVPNLLALVLKAFDILGFILTSLVTSRSLSPFCRSFVLFELFVLLELMLLFTELVGRTAVRLPLEAVLALLLVPVVLVLALVPAMAADGDCEPVPASELSRIFLFLSRSNRSSLMAAVIASGLRLIRNASQKQSMAQTSHPIQ